MITSAPETERNAGVFVEFVGAAGIGKSYLARALLKELSLREVLAHDVDAMSALGFLARLRMLPGAAYLAALGRPRNIPAWAEATRQILRYQNMRRRCDLVAGIHVTSEGIFHKLRGLSRKSERLGMADIADRLLGHIAPPQVVVILQASAEMVFARRVKRQRPKDEFTDMSVRDDVASTAMVVETARFIRQTRAQDMQIIVMTVDSTDPNSAVKMLADLLCAHRNACRRP